jgi:hypothetical protein
MYLPDLPYLLQYHRGFFSSNAYRFQLFKQIQTGRDISSDLLCLVDILPGELCGRDPQADSRDAVDLLHHSTARQQKHITASTSVRDPDVFGPSGSGSTSQRYGSGSFYHHAKTMIPTIL